MSHPILTRTALSLAALSLVVACGGGSSSRSAADDFAASYRGMGQSSDRLYKAAGGSGDGRSGGAATTITNAQLFQGAEVIFPDLFPTRSAPVNIENLPFQGKTFQVRGYSNGNYLGIGNDGRLYGLGPYTNGQLVDFGLMQSYGDLVCGRINCAGSGSGALNGCVEPASTALRIGNTFAATYVNNVLSPVASSGEWTIRGTVEAPATFEGQSAVRVASAVTGRQSGQDVNLSSKTYVQAAANELTRTLGDESDVSFDGQNLTSRTVFNPPSLNDEFTLQVGQSLTKTTSTTTTFVNAPFPLPPTSGSSTTTYTYEARETISVQGRSWDTCRYREVTSDAQGFDVSWYIVGRGLPARTEVRNSAGTTTERSELKSATINGAPL